MFLVVFRFFSLVFFVGLKGFLPSSYFFLTILCSTKLAFKKRGNCNNVTFGVKSSRSGSHVTTIIQNFTLVSLTSITMPHFIELPFGATILSHPMYLTTYILNFSPFTQSESISACENYLCFVHLLKNEVIIS